MGLVDELVPPGSLRERVQAYAEDLAAKPAPALAAIRRCITEGGGRGFEEGLAIELDAAAALAGTTEFQEGVRRFVARRSGSGDN